MSSDLSLHPSAKPADRLLFAPTRDHYGVRLALVFGNHAPGGQCPYYAGGKCHHCDIGAGEGVRFTAEWNRQRLAWFREYYCQVVPDVGHLVLYNSGSFLNPGEMPVDLLDEILSWTRSLPTLRVVSVESREMAITRVSVRRLADGVGSGRTARVILGLETADDRLRNEVLAKRIPRPALNKAVETIGLVAADLGAGRLGLAFNILVGGPGTTPQNLLDDALATARFAWECGRIANVPVDLNLHPYYRSARGQTHFPTHARCSHQPVARLASALAAMAASLNAPTAIFIGTADEGFDRDLIPAGWETGVVREAIAKFNQSQDPSVLQSICLAGSCSSDGCPLTTETGS
jgi:hypothetical protein